LFRACIVLVVVLSEAKDLLLSGAKQVLRFAQDDTAPIPT